jgi:hypothetical protein
LKAGAIAWPKDEELGSLGLRGLRMVLTLCYVNFVLYLVLYISGMYINIYVTSGINTIGIADPTNVFHMVVSSLIFLISFIVAAVGFLYGMRKVALFSMGAIVSLIVATVGGLLFLATGGARSSGSLTLIGGWVMSILFMLALFLSYYSTLKIMRAIRVVEAVSGPQEGA